MSEALNKAKSEVVRACKIISGNGYVLGTAGNVSSIVEGENLFVITPSSYPYNIMEEGSGRGRPGRKYCRGG